MIIITVYGLDDVMAQWYVDEHDGPEHEEW